MEGENPQENYQETLLRPNQDMFALDIIILSPFLQRDQDKITDNTEVDLPIVHGRYRMLHPSSGV